MRPPSPEPSPLHAGQIRTQEDDERIPVWIIVATCVSFTLAAFAVVGALLAAVLRDASGEPRVLGDCSYETGYDPVLRWGSWGWSVTSLLLGVLAVSAAFPTVVMRRFRRSGRAPAGWLFLIAAFVLLAASLFAIAVLIQIDLGHQCD
jgi:hypothetical protein